MTADSLLWLAAGTFTTIFYFAYRYSAHRREDAGTAGSSEFETLPAAAFRTKRLTQTTFLVSEYNDIYGEHPQIFVKRIPSARTILIVDTGCGGVTADPDIKITSLRQYIEEVGLSCNGGAPLNEGRKMEYVVVATHCHYDHILGMEQFNDSCILASAHSPCFIAPSNLPKHSLCESMGIKTPEYSPVLVPHEHEIHSSTHVPLGVTVLHTPGHTPDEVALYDATERMLYVGDSLYEQDTIIFPKEGSIVQWMGSVEYLIAFVRAEEEPREVRINSGHQTARRPALEVLEAAKKFMQDVIAEREPIWKRERRRGEENVLYVQKGGRFALRCPERLVLEARKMSSTEGAE